MLGPLIEAIAKHCRGIGPIEGTEMHCSMALRVRCKLVVEALAR